MSQIDFIKLTCLTEVMYVWTNVDIYIRTLYSKLCKLFVDNVIRNIKWYQGVPLKKIK